MRLWLCVPRRTDSSVIIFIDLSSTEAATSHLEVRKKRGLVSIISLWVLLRQTWRIVERAHPTSMLWGSHGLLSNLGILAQTKSMIVLRPCLLEWLKLTLEILYIVLYDVSIRQPINFYFSIKSHYICRLYYKFSLVISICAIFNFLISDLNVWLSTPLNMNILTMIVFWRWRSFGIRTI